MDVDALTAIAVPIGELVTARPEDMLIDVLEAKQDTDARVLVSSGERLVGIVSPGDIARAVERLSLLRRTAPRPPTPVPPPPAPPTRRSHRSSAGHWPVARH